MTKLHRIRVQLLVGLGRVLGVPVQIHQTFFTKGMSWKRSGSVDAPI